MDHNLHKQLDYLLPDSMSLGLRLSYRIQEDLITLLNGRDVDSETVTSVCQIVVNHFKEQLPRPRTHLGKSRQRQDQMEREILSLYEDECESHNDDGLCITDPSDRNYRM